MATAKKKSVTKKPDVVVEQITSKRITVKVKDGSFIVNVGGYSEEYDDKLDDDEVEITAPCGDMVTLKKTDLAKLIKAISDNL